MAYLSSPHGRSLWPRSDRLAPVRKATCDRYQEEVGEDQIILGGSRLQLRTLIGVGPGPGGLPKIPKDRQHPSIEHPRVYRLPGRCDARGGEPTLVSAPLQPRDEVRGSMTDGLKLPGQPRWGSVMVGKHHSLQRILPWGPSRCVRTLDLCAGLHISARWPFLFVNFLELRTHELELRRRPSTASLMPISYYALPVEPERESDDRSKLAGRGCGET